MNSSPPIKRRSSLLFGPLFLFASAAFCLSTRPVGFVTDEADLIQPDNQQQLEQVLQRVKATSGVEIAVVTVSALEGKDVVTYANELFQEWGIGEKGKDNGVLFLIAPQERKIRIEVGYGLEGQLTDAAAGRLLDEAVLPFFRQQQFEQGILNGATALIERLAPQQASPFPPRSTSAARRIDITGLLFLMMMLLFLFRSRRSPPFYGGGSGRGWSGGHFGGGGFGGFGGGLSGGGGASRGW